MASKLQKRLNRLALLEEVVHIARKVPATCTNPPKHVLVIHELEEALKDLDNL